MRTVTLVLALTAACAVSPALAQSRILTVQERSQAPQAPQAAPALPAQAAPAPAAQPAPEPAAPAAPAAAPATPPPATESEKSAATPAPDAESQLKWQDRVPRRRLGRYFFRPVASGFLRLDRRTGKVSYCASDKQTWSCEAVAENRAALEQQIDELRNELTGAKAEIAALKREIANLNKPPPPPPHPTPPQTVPPTPSPSDNTGGVTIRLPSHEDIARARGFIADTWHRLVDMIESMQKDLLRKGGDGNGVSRT